MSAVASDILGVSGRLMLDALISGDRDPAALAALAKRRLRSKIPELTEALNGRFTAHHTFLARVHLDLIDRHTEAVEQLTERIEVTGHSGKDDSHDRVRRDRVDNAGSVALRVAGRLHHIGVGRTHARTRVILLVCDLHVRIVNAATGELLRDLDIDPTKNYQPTSRPPRPTPK